VRHPYEQIGDYARWDTAVSKLPPGAVDPVVSFPLRITREQPMVTAGSCFAQHIGRYLKRAGFNYLVSEEGHPLLDEQTKQAFNYGLFSARYGNLYTSRQLDQLFRRAYGDFVPQEKIWPGRAGFVDPFPPSSRMGFLRRGNSRPTASSTSVRFGGRSRSSTYSSSRSGLPSAGRRGATAPSFLLRPVSGEGRSTRIGTSSSTSGSRTS
jgi:hypothetical protein